MRKAIIIGAGPAGLTAGYELLKRANIQPVVLEASGYIGGLSKTIDYKGNKIDIGGHRFFSKSDRVMDWWLSIMPIQKLNETDITSIYHRRTQEIETHSDGPDPESVDRLMLLRNRLSRIYYMRKFFDYPVRLNSNTIKNLGISRMIKIGMGYVSAKMFPRKPEKTLEDFFINRFGLELYKTFFRDYTKKVWGVPCSQISAEWGAQRVKGLSISKTLAHAVKSLFKRTGSIRQKDTETSLIERFLYPKYGPGHLWETVANEIKNAGGTILTNRKAVRVISETDKIVKVIAINGKTGAEEDYSGDFFFSSMPVKDLIAGWQGEVPINVKDVAGGLVYRDFITVGLLLERLKISQNGHSITDNWIYIQESDVKVGRLQIFNNWSPYMVKDPSKIWIGLEYFCNEDDDLWNLSDEQIIALAKNEMGKIGIIELKNVLDAVVVREPKTYPAYFGTYNRLNEIRGFVDHFDNLFLVGRNGMHKYNNQDHSMLTAMVSVDNIINNIKAKDNIWAVNTEEEFHEGK